MKSKYRIEQYKDQTFNNWTILSFSHIDLKQQQYWNCRCRCGFEKAIRSSHIIRGLSKGCHKCRTQSIRNTNSSFWKGGEFISSTMYTTYKLSAEKRNIDFYLTIADIENQWKIQDGKCAYTKQNLTLSIHNRDREFNASIDRINSAESYSIDNIQWVTKEVNLMKMNLTESRFIELCKMVAANN